jgi:hypothetical protein
MVNGLPALELVQLGLAIRPRNCPVVPLMPEQVTFTVDGEPTTHQTPPWAAVGDTLFFYTWTPPDTEVTPPAGWTLIEAVRDPDSPDYIRWRFEKVMT